MNKPDYNVDDSVIGSLAADEEIKPGFVVVGALATSLPIQNKLLSYGRGS